MAVEIGRFAGVWAMYFRTAGVLATLLMLTGCGVIYIVPKVHEGAAYGPSYGTDFDVEVVPMTYESAAAANLEPYVPPRLPPAFQPGATQAVASSLAQADLPPLPTRAERPDPRGDAVVGELPPAIRPQPYRIGVGDVLLLAVKGVATLDGLPDLISAQAKREGYTVQDNGTISIPDVGRVSVADMTLEEAEGAIVEALFAANIEPSFSLEVAEFNSQHVAVGGLVGQPTLVPITLEPLRLYEALAVAGGVETDDPGVTSIQLLRDGETYRFSVERFIDDPAARDLILRDGDSIYVGSAFREYQRYFEEEVALRDLRRGLEQEVTAEARERVAEEQALFEKRLSLGAVARDYVFMTGEVRNSGQATLPFEQSLYLANVLFGEPGGGIDIETGNFGAIYVIRAESDPRKAGGLTAYHLDAENVANLAVAARFEMRPNDVVFVAEQPVTSWNRVLRQVFPLITAPQRVATSVAGLP